MRKLWIGGNSFHSAMRVVSGDSPQKHTRNITRAFLAIANDFISAFLDADGPQVLYLLHHRLEPEEE